VNTLSYQELLSYESGGQINRRVAAWSVWTLLLDKGGCEFISVHLYFGFMVGAHPCDFFPYGWHFKVSVQYTVGYVPWRVGRHSENSVLQSL